MSINPGKTQVSTMTLLAILSLSLVVNLPGLAVTPMLSTLANIFPDTTQTEKQLLTVMPNLLIIPFVLLSGRLSLTRHKIATIVCGLALFVVSGVAYMFARTMVQLIIISCVLGCAAGLIIPFAAGLIADCFSGPQRMKIMGFKSGTSNLALVIATFAVGYLSSGNWHLPFVVYLIGIVPLIFALWLKGIPKYDLSDPQISGSATTSAPSEATPAVDITPQPKTVDGFYLGKIMQVIGIYLFITFTTMVITYYCPFLIESEHLPDSLTGGITAVYYLFIFIPGFLLYRIVNVTKGMTLVVAGVSMFVGVAIFALFHQEWMLYIGSALAGFGYGISQPLIYDKASRVVDSPAKSTLALAIVLAANYVAIALTPFIIDIFRSIFHAGSSEIFPFYFSAALLAGYVGLSILRRKSFGFSISKTFY